MRTPTPLAASLVALALVAAAGPAGAFDIRAVSARWSQGAPWNASLPVHIEQGGSSPYEVDIDPDWATEPFEVPFYWDARLTLEMADGSAWAVDLLHHKLFLQNPPPGVQYYNHSHGYNILHLLRQWPWRGNRLSAGAGVVVLHPENMVRFRRYPETGGHLGHGYWLSGPSIMAGIERRVELPGPFHLAGELRGNWSIVWPGVVDGDSRMQQAALHFLLGVGTEWGWR